MQAALKHLKRKVKDGIDNEGIVTITRYMLDTATDKARAHEIDEILGAAELMPRPTYQELVRELSGLCESRTEVRRNLCVKAGRSVFAGILAGELTYTGIINYGLLGTSATAVADSDTQLVAEVKRKGVATRSRTNDQLTLDFFYSKGDTNGTYQEFGMVIDGNTSANTGQLFNRLLTGGWTKSSSEALTVSVQVNINHA